MTDQDATATENSPATPGSYSVFAIWSLVLGLLSIVLCLNVVTGIPAVILGIIGIKKIGAPGSQFKGKGLAIAGISTGAAGSLAAPAMLAIAMPAIISTKDRAVQAQMIEEMKMISTACQIYAIDNNNQFPDNLSNLFPVYLADESILTFTDPKTNAELPYIYFAGSTPDSQETKPLLLSPTAFRGERVIIYNNGSFERAPAEAAEALLKPGNAN